MGLDARLHVMYGYKLEGSPITNALQKENEEGCISDEEYDNAWDTLINSDTFVEDTMCGNYEYIGLSAYNESSNYGDDNHFGMSVKELKELMDDEKLDKMIQEKCPWIVGDLYDVCGLMNGELPKLWVVKNVW